MPTACGGRLAADFISVSILESNITQTVYFVEICATARIPYTPTIDYHKWKKPAHEWLCLNADASISFVDGVGTIGGALRDSFETWLQGYRKCVGKVSTIQFLLLVFDEEPEPVQSLIIRDVETQKARGKQRGLSWGELSFHHCSNGLLLLLILLRCYVSICLSLARSRQSKRTKMSS
ncbi:hypothetical protein V6N11_032973 [Hibiscus sabdariffa]|uniref:Uncharacterized protein n=1 Tax=Hibiscus sabdariffa TaxID=183260 RepID=A0ABR1Z6Z1_9ROSI